MMPPPARLRRARLPQTRARKRPTGGREVARSGRVLRASGGGTLGRLYASDEVDSSCSHRSVGGFGCAQSTGVAPTDAREDVAVEDAQHGAHRRPPRSLEVSFHAALSALAPGAEPRGRASLDGARSAPCCSLSSRRHAGARHGSCAWGARARPLGSAPGESHASHLVRFSFQTLAAH